MRGHDQLGAFGRRYEQFRQVGERIRVQPQLRFFDADQRGRRDPPASGRREQWGRDTRAHAA